jgi:hypothetical protein
MAIKNSKWLVGLVLVTVCVLGGGCGVNRRYANNAIQQMAHSSATIQYELSDPGVALTGGESDAQSGSASRGVQKLSIVYPHPSERLGHKYAEVTLRAEAGSESGTADTVVKHLVTNPFRDAAGSDAGDGSPHESVLTMAIPKQEMDSLLRDIVADGFFDRGERQGGVDLNVSLGSRSARKSWDHVPSLDRLATRLREAHRGRGKVAGPAPKSPAVPVELMAPHMGPPATDLVTISEDVDLVPDPANF